MTHFPEPELGKIRFIFADDTNLAREPETGAEADYVLISKDRDDHASISGTVAASRNEAKLDELWPPFVGARVMEGRQDPRVTRLRCTPEVAEIWTSTTASLKFGLEVLRA